MFTASATSYLTQNLTMLYLWPVVFTGIIILLLWVTEQITFSG